MRNTLLCVLCLPACRDHDEGAVVRAIVDVDRPEHYFDLPFPSDDLLDEQGRPQLDGFPQASSDLAAAVVGGWAARLELTAQGFGNHSAAYFRFDGALDLPSETEGLGSDPALLVAMDGSELLPLSLRFVQDPAGDPFWASNTLAMAPALGHPPRSGERYAAVVMVSAGARPPRDYELPAGVAGALAAAGVKGQAAVATVFTVQDVAGQMAQLCADADQRLGDWGKPEFKRVVQLDYAPGETESGQQATVATAIFEDGSSRAAYLDAWDDEEGTHSCDLLDGWPMAVWEAEIPMPNYQGLDDRPYMNPGVTHLLDVDRATGWIDFEDGQLVSVPETELVRVTVSLPLDEDGQPMHDAQLLIWDHGTGGHAYNAVQRGSVYDDGLALASALAEAGYAVIGHDAPHYGTRYPLIDEGYDAYLGFYNIVNLPAFRDNLRQAGLEGHVLLRFAQQALNELLPAGSADAGSARRGGHSMGSVTANLALAGAPEAWSGAFLSGSGGLFAHYFLDTGMLADFDPALFASLFAALGADMPEELTPAAAMGAVLGLEEEAWDQLDRLHPAVTLFQWTMDPADPMSAARAEELPITILMGVGDHQVPNFTTEGLQQALPQAELWPCEAGGDYDPHYCLHREQEGWDILAEWAE